MPSQRAGPPVLQLCEDGKLELDQPVVDYLPEFTMADSRYKEITVGMLLNHTAAFPGTYTNNAGTPAPDTSKFNGKAWIPTNLSAIDGTAVAFKTGVLNELPGYIYFTANGGYTLYGLKDANTTQMVLPYGRDQAQAMITENNGQAVLSVMNYQLMNTADLVSLQKDEPISIGSDGLNVCRKIDREGNKMLNN